MIRRLIEADYVHVENPSGDKIKFWLMESRTPRMLVELAQRYREETEGLLSSRPLLANAIAGDKSSVEDGLEKEQKLERDADRRYWEPLFKELEGLRHLGYEPEEEVYEKMVNSKGVTGSCQYNDFDTLFWQKILIPVFARMA
jgi:hypothetical protein